MKLIKNSPLLIIIFLTFSCQTNNELVDLSKTDAISIIGTWKLTSDISNGIEYVEEGDCDVLYIFTDTTISIEEYYGGNCDDVDLADNSWTYTIQNDYIIGFDVDEITQEDVDAEIVELNELTLKLKSPDNDQITMIRL